MLTLKKTTQSEREWEQVRKAFLRLTSPRVSDLRPVQQAIRDGFADNFTHERSRGGVWPALAASTARDRERKGYGAYHPILVRTGDYRDSFVNAANPDHVSKIERRSGSLRIYEGSNDYRVIWHELGTRFMPARPVLPLSSSAEQNLAIALRNMVDRTLRKRNR